MRKPPAKQRAMSMPVYEHDRPAPELLEAGVPERFAPVKYLGMAAGAGSVAGWNQDAAGWTPLPEARAFRLTPAAGDAWRWVRYRHLRPTRQQWEDAIAGRPVGYVAPKLILDQTSYNPDAKQPFGTFWVGDLELSLTLELLDLQAGAGVLLELIEGDRTYRCRIDPATGTAVMSSLDSLAGAEAVDAAADGGGGEPGPAETLLGEGVTPIVGPGEYELVFANVDDRLTLWVDGAVIPFGPESPDGVVYRPFSARRRQRPYLADLVPAGFAVRNAAARAGQLAVRRDIYYQGSFRDPDSVLPGGRRQDPGGRQLEFFDVEVDRLGALAEAAADPDAYAARYERDLLTDRRTVGRRVYELELGPDEYLMLGDNSPSSLDSRLWSNERGAPRRHAVPRDALVGTAFAVYWPHGEPIWFEEEDGVVRGFATDAIPGLDRWFYHVGTDGRVVTEYQEHGVPFLPNFERLFRRIR